jgi:microcin C transport system substrate-binding protein
MGRTLTTAVALVTLLAGGIAASAQDATPDGAVEALPAVAEPAAEEGWATATSLIETPRYPPGFAHFNYVNPDAPQGGVARLSGSSPTFDTLNPILPKGVPADGLGLIYESLMMRALDELDISGQYPQLAASLRFPDDYAWVSYRLNPAARWHDGEPVTAEDVVWSFETLIEINPSQGFYYQHVTGAEITGEREVTFTFDQTGNRELPQIVGELIVLPKHWWEGVDANGKQRDIAESTLEPPPGSGPYRIKEAVPGRSIVYEKAPDFWGAGLNTNVGQNNFDEVRFEYYRDLNIEFEAFKSDEFDYWAENEAKRWATAYDFPAMTAGKVKKELVELDQVSGVMVGFVPNLRRPFFQDVRVRRALNLAFDFEELNRTIFFGQYERINSFFYGIPIGWSGLPQGKELEILDSLRDMVPAQVFTEEYQNPVGGDPQRVRENLKAALDLLAQAGYELLEPSSGLSPLWFVLAGVVLAGIGAFAGGTRRTVLAVGGLVVAGLAYGGYALWLKPPTVTQTTLVNAETGEPAAFEILLNGPTIERVAIPYQGWLKRLGIDVTVRSVDSSQFVTRVRSRDFDVIYTGWGQSNSPGNEQLDYWGSEAADREASRNYAGIKDPAVDAIIRKIILAENREDQIAAIRALDRVMMWNQYVIPTYTVLSDRIAYWDRFGHPDGYARFSIGFPTVWWWDEEKAARVGGTP